jgi:hypothetical protein
MGFFSGDRARHSSRACSSRILAPIPCRWYMDSDHGGDELLALLVSSGDTRVLGLDSDGGYDDFGCG